MLCKVKYKRNTSTQSEYQLFNMTSSNSPEMTLGGKPHTKEIDTGALVLVISQTTYHCKFNEYKLQESSMHLRLMEVNPCLY